MTEKFFKAERTQRGYGEPGIVLGDHIFSIRKTSDGVTITEECDGYYEKTFTKDQAIELFEEAIRWIKGDG